MDSSSLCFNEDGEPVCKPFDCLAEVQAWQPGPKYSSTNRLTQEVQTLSMSSPNTKPQVLVCHDMCGGYLDDRFTQGKTGSSSCYSFYHWHLIDTFVYFSHHFVTIPPVGWIRAAHQAGVGVLGTVITEWEAGAQACQEFLRSPEAIDEFTDKLALLAQVYNFDGWLVNIENVVEAGHVASLHKFVERLTLKCHTTLTSAKVIWYDSVISTGELKWQDELNEHNKMFFEVCDGIFLNYLMTREKLQRSKAVAGQNGRQFDVYAGIDVFGRGTPSGGGFNTKEDLAMIQSEGLSTAIFAPGWVYEFLGPKDFEHNQEVFWGLLSQHLPPRPVTLPMASSFCRGAGDGFYVDGQAVDKSPWQDLSLQQIQPTFNQSQFMSYTLHAVVEEKQKESVTESQSAVSKADVKPTFKVTASRNCPRHPQMCGDKSEAFFGGSCLSLSVKRESVFFSLHNFKLEEQSPHKLNIKLIWKCPLHQGVPFCFVVLVHCIKGNLARMVMCCDDPIALPTNPSLHLLQSVRDSWGDHAQQISYVTMKSENYKQDWRKSTIHVPSEFLLSGSGERCYHVTTGVMMLPVIPADQRSVVKLGHINVSQDDLFLFPDSLGMNGPSKVDLYEVRVNSKLDEVKLKKVETLLKFFNIAAELSDSLGTLSQHHVSLTEGAQPQNVGLKHSLELADGSQQKYIKSEHHADLNQVPHHQNVDSKHPVDSIEEGETHIPVRHTLDLTNDAQLPVDTIKVEPYTLCILQWSIPSDHIDYYLIYRLNEEGDKRTLLGHSVCNSFVWRQKQSGEETQRLCIKPVTMDYPSWRDSAMAFFD